MKNYNINYFENFENVENFGNSSSEMLNEFPPENQYLRCTVGTLLEEDGDEKKFSEELAETGHQNYLKIRDSNQRTQQQTNVINSLLNDSNFCTGDTPQMMGSNAASLGENGYDGYALNCYNLEGNKIPDCACDPACFPNTLGCFDDEIRANRCLTETEESSEAEPINVSQDVQEGDCPKANFKNATENISNMAQAMGMDQTCKMATETSQANGSAHGNISLGPFLKGNVGAQFMSSSSKNSSEGCAQRILNVTRQTTDIQNIQCQINRLKVNQNKTIKGNVSIIFTVSTDGRDTIERIINKAFDNQAALSNIQNLEIYKMQRRDAAEALRQAQALMVTTISGNTFTASSTINDETINVVENESALELVSQHMADLKTEVENELLTDLGTGALTPNINEVINNEVANNLKNISSAILETTSTTDINIDSNNRIEITVPFGTTFTNNVVDASNIMTIVTSSLVKSRNQMAANIKNKIISDAFSDSTTTTTVAGLDEIVRLMGEANVNYAKTGDKMWEADMMGAIVIGAIVVGVLILFGFIAYILFSGGENSAAVALAEKGIQAKKTF